MRYLLLFPVIVMCGCQKPKSPPAATPLPVLSESAPAAVPQVRLEKTTGKQPSLQLTASDGTGLKLISYQAKAVVQGPMAFSELHLTFANPDRRILEGRFQVRLPEGAALSRFAMKTSQGWQEAEVVELQQARRVYEDYLHRRQDPALLEKEAGNLFSARVFPIPASGRKELILAYSEELPQGQPYRLALAGLPALQNFDFEGQVWTRPDQPARRLLHHFKNQVPSGDLLLEGARWSRALQSQEGLTLVPVRVPGKAAAAPLEALLIAVDTSASLALEATAQQARLSKLAALLPPDCRVSLVAFDQEVVPLYTGPAQGMAAGLAKLQARPRLGCTDLAKLSRYLGGQADYPRALILSDGVATAGGLPKGTKSQRYDVLLCGGVRDRSTLSPLVLSQRCGWFLEADDDLRLLQQQPVPPLPVTVEGAAWQWPNQLQGGAPGQERLVYARLPGNRQSLSVKVGEEQQTLEVSSVEWPLLQRSAVAADLQRQMADYRACQDQKAKGALGALIIQQSCDERVICDLTGMLVLESDQEYSRFGLKRTALADILVVGPQGLQREQRQNAVLPQHPLPKPVDELSLPTLDSGESPPPTQVYRARPRRRDERLSAYSRESSNGASQARTTIGGAGAIEMLLDQSPPPPTRRGGEQLPLYNQSISRPAAEPVSAPKLPQTPALNGTMREVEQLLSAGKLAAALEKARRWQAKDPANVLALVALGRALAANNQKAEAARAYASIIDLYPGRADLRRYAGCLLESLGAEAQELALDTFQKALDQRPDHPASHRLTAYALVRLRRLPEAYQVLQNALSQNYPGGRFAEVTRILQEDLELVGAAWRSQGGSPSNPVSTTPSTRFVLTWETDANDVDFHIKDSRGGHAFYSSPQLPSGGSLYADVTTGYGPECFTIPGQPGAGPYSISAHYYSRGPMGYGMGKVEIIRHDGKGHLTFEQRPFLVMNDRAFVDLGQVR